MNKYRQWDVEVVLEDHLIRHCKDGPKSMGIVQVLLDLMNGGSFVGVSDRLIGRNSTQILVLNAGINNGKLDLFAMS